MGRPFTDPASARLPARFNQFALSATLGRYEVEEMTAAEAARLMGVAERERSMALGGGSGNEQSAGGVLDWNPVCR